MGRFAEHFEGSEFPARRRPVRGLLDGMSDEARREADAVEPSETLDRLDVALRWVEAVVAGTDPRLLAATMLENADAQLSQIETSLNTFIENEDESQIGSI